MHPPTTSGPLPSDIQTVVVGGGILGLCVAGFLAEEGREVAIIDARRVADGRVCTLKLRENAGITFHGTWVPTA